MRFRPGIVGLALVLSAAAAPGAQAQEGCWLARGSMAEAAERPSPLKSAAHSVGDAELRVCYGAPSSKGRGLLGGAAHPMGTDWRMGANEATTLHLPVAAEIAGVSVDPGTYSLYATLGESEWEIHVNSQAERWGVPINGEVMSATIGSGSVAAGSTSSHVETLTYSFEDHGGGHVNLIMEFEGSRVEIPIQLSM